MERRKIYLDNISGIMLIHMMFIVHCAKLCALDFVANPLMYGLVCFMPWFFFKSGMFFEIDRPVKEVVNRSFYKLVVPYAFFSLLGWAVVCLPARLFFDHWSFGHVIIDTLSIFVKTGSIRGNFALWFLLSLFMVRILFRLLVEAKIPSYIIAGLSFICAIFFNKKGAAIPCYFGNVSNGLFFFSMGYLLKDIQFRKLLQVFSLILFSLSLVYPIYLDFRQNIVWHDKSYILVEMYCLGGIVFFNGLFQRWLSIKIPIVTSVGRDSMFYYLIHYIVLAGGWNVFRFLITNEIILFVLCSLLMVLSFFLFHRFYSISYSALWGRKNA